jgi:coproporphyrinogen III oxidase
MNVSEIEAAFRQLQDEICTGLAALDGGAAFSEDTWLRPGGGGGRSRVIAGERMEKGGVNFSAVHGMLPDALATSMGVDTSRFSATGVSIVLHPRSPMAPIIHMNVRYFELETGKWWFGGGIDLTPHYVVPEDAADFHKRLKAVCDGFDPGFYPAFKKQADDYFFIRHRGETRGVGGIFFDYLQETSGHPRERLFAFSQAVGRAFVPAYAEQLQRADSRPYGPEQEAWQRLRRGRYVEFNLVWDRGTRFGLETNGRTESILMSMPPRADWVYNHQVIPGSAEAQTLEWLKKDIDWVNLPVS